MKLFSNRKIKIACGVAMTMFSVAACGVGVFAWFTIINNVEGKNAELGVKNAFDFKIIDEYTKIYYWDFDNNCAKCKLTGNELDLNLHTYDSFITSRNAYNARYVEIKIEFLRDVPANKNINADMICTGNYVYVNGTTKYVDTNTSNVTKYKYKVKDIETKDIASPEDEKEPCTDVYNRLKETFAEKDEIKFVKQASVDVSESQAKDKEIYDASMEIGTAKSKGDVMYLLMEYDYDVDLVTYFSNHLYGRGTDIQTITKDSIKCTADISKIELSVYDK